MKPRLLDLFCGAGGAAMGYHRAGFEVVGVDINPQPNYPFEFHQGDALAWVRDRLGSGIHFDAIHASPPCQAHTTMSNRWRGAGGKADSHFNWIDRTRKLIWLTGLPFVLENVVGARRAMQNPALIAGGSFGLGVDRPRLFETNFNLVVPKRIRVDDPVGVYGKSPDGRLLFRRKDGSEQHAASSTWQAGEAMGIDWMEWRELAEAIPPAYTEFIGKQLLSYLERTENEERLFATS